MNEADVRDEVAVPFLAALGYRRGTENDILREFPLSYDRIFLGRKKKTDPPLRGRADYILAVTGVARWVLEVKAPTNAIGRDEFDQAISYARHPEISGAYAAVTNGRRFVVFHISQASSEPPLIDLEFASASELAQRVASILAPAAIRRDCSPPKVDLEMPLADGFRSAAKVVRGTALYLDSGWHSNLPLPDSQPAAMDEMCRRLREFRSTITGGRIWRDAESRVRAKLEWGAIHNDLLKFAREKKILDSEYISLSSTISTNRESPTTFDLVGSFSMKAGEPMFDLNLWRSEPVSIDGSMAYRGQATGYLDGSQFTGDFQAEYEVGFPAAPELIISIFALGSFELTIDP